MINLLFFVVLLAIGLITRNLAPVSIYNNATYALGLIILSGYIFGRFSRLANLPSLVGFILAGLVIGPHVTGIVSETNVADLQLLNGLALSIIALTAGGEIRMAGLKANFKTIGLIVWLQTIFLLIGIPICVLLLKPWIPFLAGEATAAVLATGLLVAIVSTASSPSTTLAVIVESKLKNRMTEIILSIVMLKDILILFLFVIGLSLAKTLLGDILFNPTKIFSVLIEIAGSFGLGILAGLFITVYLKFVKKDTIVFILALSFFIYEIFEPLQLHPLLIMMVAGFIIQNFSTEGNKLIETLESISPPIYVIFFTLAGAAVNLNYLKSIWLLTCVLVVARIALKFCGTWFGCNGSGQSSNSKKYLWMAFISQAGLSLGMAKLIENHFGTFGGNIAALIIAIIIINQIIGPFLLKISLAKLNRDRISQTDPSS